MTYARQLASSFIVPTLLVLAAGSLLAGCTDADSPSGQLSDESDGEIDLDLRLGSGATLNAVTYAITGPGGYAKTGSIDVTNGNTISATIGGIPAGTAYTISLSGTTTDGATACNGSAGFSVTGHQTTPVTVAVLCKEQTRTGSAAINGTLNICPVIDGVSTNASDVYVGGTVTLEALAHDSDAGPSPIAYQWTTTAGSLSNMTAASTTLTCNAPGAATVSLNVSDGDPAASCADMYSTTITCTTPVCAGGCDDQNPCTSDVCNANLTCSHPVAPDGSLCQGGNLRVKILGFNDFHGHISAGTMVGTRPAGGAGVMTAYLKQARAGMENQTIIAHAGDHVGASPASSALLQDEPSIQWLNQLANASCAYEDKANAQCNVVATLGNHEFDEGKSELLRLLNGGNHVAGPFLEDPYRGARFPYVSSNVVDEVTNTPILPPYVIKRVMGVPIAFVGAVLEATPTIVTPTGVAGLRFLDEATAANSYIPEIKAQGVRAIVLLIHQGGSQSSYTASTNTSLTNSALNGADILDVVTRLDDEFDVVVSGHSHSFTNLLVTNNGGKKILVTQAFSFSTAYGDIDLTIDPVTDDVVSKSARIVTTFGDIAPGTSPDPAAVALTSAAEAKVAPLVGQIVGSSPGPLTRNQNTAGESALGDLIADAQTLAMGTQFGFMNPGGIREDLKVPAGGGTFTWNDLFTIQPFGNTLVKMNMTGAQIKALLEQQWQPTVTRMLQISGLTYTWDNALPVGSRVVEIRDAGGTLLDPAATYTVTTNNFLATGGDGFSTFIGGTNQIGGPVDLDALIEYTEHHDPLVTPVLNRITRLH